MFSYRLCGDRKCNAVVIHHDHTRGLSKEQTSNILNGFVKRCFYNQNRKNSFFVSVLCSSNVPTCSI